MPETESKSSTLSLSTVTDAMNNVFATVDAGDVGVTLVPVPKETAPVVSIISPVFIAPEILNRVILACSEPVHVIVTLVSGVPPILFHNQ